MVTPSFNKQFVALIWQLQVDEQNGDIYIETRQEKNKSTGIFRISARELELSEVSVSGEVDWWSSLKGVFGGLLVFNIARDHTNPGPGDLLIFDPGEMKNVLVESNFLFDGMEDGIILGQKVENETRTEHRIDLSDFLDNYDPVEEYYLMAPYFIESSDEDFSIVSDFLVDEGVTPVIGADYMESESNIFLGYHVKAGKGLDRYIMWIKDGEVRIHKKIDEGMKGVASESFITSGNRLIFVENRRSLTIYEI